MILRKKPIVESMLSSARMIIGEKIKGVIEVMKTINTSTPEYKYKIDAIELKHTETAFFTLIHYKIVGCRIVRRESAQDLNTSAIFALFKPEDAQKIVSIATAESLLNKNPKVIEDKFLRYVELCASKYSHRG